MTTFRRGTLDDFAFCLGNSTSSLHSASPDGVLPGTIFSLFLTSCGVAFLVRHPFALRIWVYIPPPGSLFWFGSRYSPLQRGVVLFPSLIDEVTPSQIYILLLLFVSAWLGLWSMQIRADGRVAFVDDEGKKRKGGKKEMCRSRRTWNH